MANLRQHLSTGIVRYGIFGVLFGFVFPAVATLFDIFVQELPVTLASAVAVQRVQPLHWIIDLAPPILGLMGSLIGIRQDRIT